VVVVPIFERRGPGVYHNSAAVVDADGSLLGVYRKMHIPDDPLYFEKYYFTPGEIYFHGAAAKPLAGFQTFDTRFGRLGVLICWDQWYPEAARLTAMQGADILLYPTAIGWHPEEKETNGAAQAEAWTLMQRSHAVANGCFVVAVNRVGFEPEPGGPGGIEFFGGSFVAGPDGRMLAQAESDAPAVIVATLENAAIERARIGWPFLRDRRIDAYGALTSRWSG
jgi:N-carbamoylputrescine amidase